MARDFEEIKYFVVNEILKNCIEGDDLIEDVERGISLTSDETQLLYRLISESLEKKVDELNKLKGVSLIMEIDSLSIYADAFAEYCQGKRIKL